jgi:hypothetical protein
MKCETIQTNSRGGAVFAQRILQTQKIAMALGGLDTPPGIFKGMEVTKKL